MLNNGLSKNQGSPLAPPQDLSFTHNELHKCSPLSSISLPKSLIFRSAIANDDCSNIWSLRMESEDLSFENFAFSSSSWESSPDMYPQPIKNSGQHILLKLLLCQLCCAMLTHLDACVSNPEVNLRPTTSLSSLHRVIPKTGWFFLWSLSSVCVYFMTLMPCLNPRHVPFGFLRCSPNWSPNITSTKGRGLFDSAL